MVQRLYCFVEFDSEHQIKLLSLLLVQRIVHMNALEQTRVSDPGSREATWHFSNN